MNETLSNVMFVTKEPLVYLLNLGRETGRSLVGDLVTIYSQDTPVEMAKIKMAVVNRGYTELSRMAHALKSSSLNLGLIVLGSIFAKIEELADGADRNDADIWCLIEDAEAVMEPSISALVKIVTELDREAKEL